ncbi:tetratricopeptide repeat protein [Rhizosaccharibacter radicis]|uniref:Tetratricopeptide repeat protein n=1 Tax=Rhizosaccharibacter radicis TaxID=2782605 RepID=A0ABT1VVW7_9PROT|nr:tetratricopeptide repeat protein [Acetobacteraceae bacterium KSS12]
MTWLATLGRDWRGKPVLPMLLLPLILASPAPPAAGRTGSVPSADGHATAERHPSRRGLSTQLPPSAKDGCSSLLADDPDAALAEADRSLAHGGGDDARECRALATIAGGDPAGGAAQLDRLAGTGTAQTSPRKADFASEAAQGWLMANRPADALRSAGTALDARPGDPELLAGHARALIAAGKPEPAVADLSRIIEQQPGRADMLVLRGQALRLAGRLEAARADIDLACRLRPDDPDALLERGILRERAGDADGARTDWQRILALSPDTHDADLAQQDLALLEADPDAS